MNIEENVVEIDENTASKRSFFKISNPYHAYDLESGRWFYHEDLIKNVKSIFEKRTLKKLIVIQGVQGSGKSSTLRRLGEDKEILGETYFPIYIDSDEFRSNEVNSYLFHIYKKMNKGIRNYKLQPYEQQFWLEQSIPLPELIRFVDRLEQNLAENKSLILIFDEFDKLQKTVENPDVIKSVVNFYHYLINETDKIRLILAGERKIVELARKTNTQDLIENTLNGNGADMEEILINLYEGQFKDTEQIHQLLDQNTERLYQIIRNTIWKVSFIK